MEKERAAKRNAMKLKKATMRQHSQQAHKEKSAATPRASSFRMLNFQRNASSVALTSKNQALDDQKQYEWAMAQKLITFADKQFFDWLNNTDRIKVLESKKNNITKMFRALL